MKLYYYVRSHGDGSVSVDFFNTLEAARAAEETQEECWGEPSVDYINLATDGTQITFLKTVYSTDYRSSIEIVTLKD